MPVIKLLSNMPVTKFPWQSGYFAKGGHFIYLVSSVGQQQKLGVLHGERNRGRMQMTKRAQKSVTKKRVSF